MMTPAKRIYILMIKVNKFFSLFGSINHGGDGGDKLINSKEKIAYLRRIGWKPKAYTSCVLYLKVFKNDLYLQYIDMCCLINHVYMHSFRSLIEATEKLKQQSGNFPGSGGIWTTFRPSEGRIWTRIFQKFKCPGPGGCWSFDLTGT